MFVLQELELRWHEYYELVAVLLQWIRHHVLVFEERKFPTSYEEIEVQTSELVKTDSLNTFKEFPFCFFPFLTLSGPLASVSKV